ncbi:hypothetical protein OP10G_2415 [Fimbriimonas ginsengisoli Gsoil 348]|uniref:Uncharacterized protein n=1 Tax=Fimbriimonas ginsengisoli Gsoil 348 TaxID=661478 RepID=A0A068NQD7_FIMGI|nr:hypothetical protein OP10G_2415 [Fimbriimonas ginsengisoli Gsoil 348]
MVLLAAGYAASQLMFFQGRSQPYAEAVDRPPVAYLAGALLLAIVVFGFIPDRESEDAGADDS